MTTRRVAGMRGRSRFVRDARTDGTCDVGGAPVRNFSRRSKMGKKGKAERKPKQRAQQQAPRPGQDAFGESGERSAYSGQAPRGDAFGESGQRSAQQGRAQQQP